MTGGDPSSPETLASSPEERSAQPAGKPRGRRTGKIVLLAVLIVLGGLLARLTVTGLLMGFLFWGAVTAKPEADTDVSHYSLYMGPDAREEYRSKWGMDESIFPAEISPAMDVKDYQMVYFDPWDAQYLSYLTVHYEGAPYEAEQARLAAIPSTEYLGYYGVTGFDGRWRLAAMNADPYFGFLYALDDGEGTIVYCMMIFCNYFMDLEYWDYMPAEYLPLGFDARLDNPYEKEKMAQRTAGRLP